MYDGGMSTTVEESALSATTDQQCCSLADSPMGVAQAERFAGILKALADPTRLRLLSHVAAQGCQDVCACDLTEELDITQPTVSHHMKKLVEAGLVIREQRGKWAHYSVIPEAFSQLRELLDLS